MFGQYESRGVVADLLAIHEHAAWRFTNWEIDTLRALQALSRTYTDPERRAVYRLLMAVDIQVILWGVVPDESPFKTAERAAKQALGLVADAKTRRKKGEKAKKAPAKPKAKITEKSVRIVCPVCSTGADLKCNLWPGGHVSFWCQNTHCVKKF